MTELSTAFETTQKPTPREFWGAVLGGKMEEVAALLEHGADPDGGVGGNFPLMIAASYGYTGIVSLLVDKGATLNIKNHLGWTPLISAAARGHIDTARILIEKDAALHITDNGGSTALMVAAAEGHVEVVRLLVENFADLDQQNNRGWTALDWVEDRILVLANQGIGHEKLDDVLNVLKDAPVRQEKIRQAARDLRDREMHDRIALKQRRFKVRAGSRRITPGGVT